MLSERSIFHTCAARSSPATPGPYNASARQPASDDPHMSRIPRSVFFLLFTVSGFAGLIYESIWSHYLKLFLGHAAYAQTLVLALFMGGMAIGSWLCSRWSAGWGNLLRGYALAEGLIGLAGLAFHPIFVTATETAYESILPARGAEEPMRARPGAGRDSEGAAPFRLFLAVALLTGAASFVFEIGWIRMLSLVLGSSTHSFELMLSAFILGIACGGYWVRRRIDSIADPVRFLGIVLVTMGLLALATLPLYGEMFGLMQAVMNALAKTETGYTLFLFSSHGIALAIMFPATFCAGITLPLITYALLHGGHGEKSIGAVYSANTLGSILGVFSAAHIGMPFLGLKGLIAAGAALDAGLGLVLLWRVAQGPSLRLGAAALSLASL